MSIITHALERLIITRKNPILIPTTGGVRTVSVAAKDNIGFPEHMTGDTLN